MIRSLLAATAVLTLGAAPAVAQEAAQAPAAAPTPALSVADAVTPTPLTVGTASVLRLETNPSTGYGWQVVETLNLRVDEPLEVVRDPATPEGRVGAPETAVIRITARSAGPASLVLAYKRPWMPASPEDRTLQFVFLAE